MVPFNFPDQVFRYRAGARRSQRGFHSPNSAERYSQCPYFRPVLLSVGNPPPPQKPARIGPKSNSGRLGNDRGLGMVWKVERDQDTVPPRFTSRLHSLFRIFPGFGDFWPQSEIAWAEIGRFHNSASIDTKIGEGPTSDAKRTLAKFGAERTSGSAGGNVCGSV